MMAIGKKIRQVLESGQLTLGPHTRIFEQMFANYVGRKDCVAVSSGHAALEAILRAYGIKNREVIVPTNTNFATAAAIIESGGRIRFADGDIELSASEVERLINTNTAGVIVVHIGGIVGSSMMKIREICDRANIFLLEDASHAHGSELFGTKAGALGHAAAFSMFATKVITSGEGGCVVTNDEDLLKTVRMLRDQGKDPSSGQHILEGGSWRMSEIHAIIGASQLSQIDRFISRRRQILRRYGELLKAAHPHLSLVAGSKVSLPSGYKCIVRVNESVSTAELKQRIAEDKQICLGSGVYDIPLHVQPVFKMWSGQDTFPEAIQFCSNHLCLPIWSHMKDEEVDRVSDYILDVTFRAAKK